MDRGIDLKKFYKGKRIIITGHTGFKGAWLSQILTNFGAKVSGYALKSDTQPSLFRILKLEKEIKHCIGDIRDYKKLKKVFVSNKPEIVLHLAAQPLVRDSYDDPLYTFETNIISTANVLQAVKETNKTKAAVMITTDKVYENKEWVYSYREIDRLGGYDPYSSSKAAAEIVIDSYIKSFFNPKLYNIKHQTLVASARAGNVIGGGDWQKDRLVPDIIRAIFEKNEKVIIRSPEAVRPWQHVLEPLSGYLLLAKQLYLGKKEFSGPWNFGPEDESFITVKELIEKIIKIAGRGSYSIKKELDKHEAGLLKLDNNKAKSILGWQPVFDIDEALKLTVVWYKGFYDKKDVKRITNDQIVHFFNRIR